MIEVKYKDETILSKKVKFNEDATITVGKGKIQSMEEVKEVLKDRLIETKDFGFIANVRYGRWIEVGFDGLFVPTTEGIVLYQGSDINKLGINGLTFGYSKKYIVALTKDDNDSIVVNIYSVSGKLIDRVNLGSQTKGTLIVSSPAIVGSKVFVPSIEGVWIIDISKNTRSFIRIGNVYSDVAIFGSDKVVVVNEVGEVYEISTEGIYNKIAQLSATTIRKASISTDKDKIIYILKGYFVYCFYW